MLVMKLLSNLSPADRSIKVLNPAQNPSSIPFAFSCFAAACERLGIAKHHYYTEHMHIDGFHAREMRAAIREYEAAAGLDCTRTWVGIQLGSALIGQAFDAAVNRARKEVMS